MATTRIEMQIRKQFRRENISTENKSLATAQLTSFLLSLPQPRTLTLLHHYIHTGNLQEEFGNQKKGITFMMPKFYQSGPNSRVDTFRSLTTNGLTPLENSVCSGLIMSHLNSALVKTENYPWRTNNSKWSLDRQWKWFWANQQFQHLDMLPQNLETTYVWKTNFHQLLTSSFLQNLWALMIISALDPQWHGNSCNMQEHFPNYDDKVFIIRRKIVTRKMTILQEY